MTKPGLAGAASLLSAPLLAILMAAVSPTLSDDAGDEVAAFTGHHGAMVAGAILQNVSIVLLIAGAGWLAVALAPRARAWAVTGGTLAVLGSLPVVYDDGVHTAVASLASTGNTALVDRILSSAGVTAVEPFSLIGDLGLAVLGVAAARAGAPRWTAVAMAVGAFGEGAGFATGTKPVVIASFVVLFAAFAVVVRALVADGTPSHAAARLDVRTAS
jgi:hypothetical protein